MTKAYSRFLTAFFCVFLGGLLVWHVLLPDREKSETENRTLAQAPEFSWTALVDGSYTKKVEDYFADQFPLRDSWTGLKARAEQLIGKSEFNGVYLCGDTLISKVERPDESLVEKNLSYVDRLSGKTDIPVYLGLIPSAAEVWKEKLPAGAGTRQSCWLKAPWTFPVSWQIMMRNPSSTAPTTTGPRWGPITAMKPSWKPWAQNH